MEREFKTRTLDFPFSRRFAYGEGAGDEGKIKNLTLMRMGVACYALFYFQKI